MPGPTVNKSVHARRLRWSNLVIDKVRPDYIQIDCKGHPGYSSYPTKVGNQAPGFVGDPLRVWRDVTQERGVSLFMHYSGVADERAVELHPEWAARKRDGSFHGRKGTTSVFGPYVDELMIPQLRELAGQYGVDGAWVDGDCWAAQLDYSEAAVQAYRKQTGETSVPQGPDDPRWQAWREFHREGYRTLPASLCGLTQVLAPKLPSDQQLVVQRSHARTGDSGRRRTFR